MPAGPEAKESPGFFDLLAFSSEVLIFFALWFSADSPTLTPGAGSKTEVGPSIPIYIVTESQVNT